MGHQEILGTRPQAPLRMPFSDVIDRVEQALKAAGWQVERRGGDWRFFGSTMRLQWAITSKRI